MRILNSNPCHGSIDQLNSVTTGLNFLPFIVSLVLSGVFAYLLYDNLEGGKDDSLGKDNSENGNILPEGNVDMTEKNK